MSKRDKVLNQIALMDIIRSKSNINIVTCGHCGSIILHERNDEDIDCAYCGSILDQCDCPDFLYTGIENNIEFEENMNGKINNSVGFTSVDGPIRRLTLRERLQQIINLGQPDIIAREPFSVSEAKIAIERYEDYYLDREVGNL